MVTFYITCETEANVLLIRFISNKQNDCKWTIFILHMKMKQTFCWIVS